MNTAIKRCTDIERRICKSVCVSHAKGSRGEEEGEEGRRREGEERRRRIRITIMM